MTDSTERYYADMEAARNEAEDAYFKARPQMLSTISERQLFRAGFERGFAKGVLAQAGVSVPKVTAPGEESDET